MQRLVQQIQHLMVQRVINSTKTDTASNGAKT